MLFEESYEVCTHWGWFRLDRGAYEDYLAGKLWITWIPGKPKEQAAEQRKEDVLPPNVTDAAIRLRDLASRHGAYATFQSAFPGVAVHALEAIRVKVDFLIGQLDRTLVGAFKKLAADDRKTSEVQCALFQDNRIIGGIFFADRGSSLSRFLLMHVPYRIASAAYQETIKTAKC